jgi:cytochrome b involved in lipid metabolism
MKRNIYIGGGIIILIIAGASIWGGSLFSKYAPNEYMVQNSNGTTTVNTTTGETSQGAKTFTIADVETHKDVTSCYSTINNTVYDLTMWINAHPGGKNPILSICGIDGTKRFMDMHHGGKKFMTILDRFKIGTLAQ